MKKNRIVLLTAVMAVLVYLSGCSEKVYVNRALTWAENDQRLDTAIKSVNKATELEETKDWPKTYYAKGFVYQKVFETENEEFKDLVEDPLVKAFENYKKAYEMDEDDRYKGRIDASMFGLHNHFIQEGVDAFEDQNYEGAYTNFKYALKVSDMPIFEEQIDTAVIYNAGIAAQQIEKWEEAAKYYAEAAEYDYEGERTYILLNNAYMQSGDTTKAVEALEEGFEKYPTNDEMIGSLVNHYLLNSDKPEKALEYLDKATEEFPDNPEYYSAKAQVYDKIEKPEKAKENYKKALEIKPDQFMSLYNLGVIYFNEGVDLETEANKTKDEEEHKELKEKAEDKFLEALPLMEKALEIEETEMSLLQTLRTLYYRLRTKDEKYLEKYEEMGQKIEQVEEMEEEEEEEQ
ncbi:MAG: tetratricopeptide repeat protein [Bacteroidales bacterium]